MVHEAPDRMEVEELADVDLDHEQGPQQEQGREQQRAEAPPSHNPGSAEQAARSSLDLGQWTQLLEPASQGRMQLVGRNPAAAQHLEDRRAIDVGRQPTRDQQAEYQEEGAAEIIALQMMQDLAQQSRPGRVGDVAVGKAQRSGFQDLLDQSQEQEDPGKANIGH